MMPTEVYPNFNDCSLRSICSFFHFQLHLFHLSPPHLLAAYVTTIFAKFYLPHQFLTIFIQVLVGSQHFICALLISISPFSLGHD